MKTVVTGGNGFIGSHLTKRLLDDNRDVVVVSDFSQLGTENLDRLGVNAKCVKANLRDYSQTLKAIEGTETVFHLAAIAGGIGYIHSTKAVEFAILQANLGIDTNVFKACVEGNVKRIIYASSCAVYPMDGQHTLGAVFSEDDLQLRAANPDGGYGWAKLVGEVQLGLMESIQIGIARIFNVYGVNEPLGEKAHAVADLMGKAISSPEKLTVWGTGEQTRDYIYVSDCVEALMALERRTSIPPLIVNIGSGKAVAIKELAERIISLSGNSLKLVFDREKPVGPLGRTADIKRAKNMLGWQPKVSLEEGLERTFGWIKNHRLDLHT